MNKLANILLAVELTEADENPIQTALTLATKFEGAKIKLIHAVEHITAYGSAYGVVLGAEIEENLLTNAEKELKDLVNQMRKTKNTISIESTVKFGSPKMVILEEADNFEADLIIVGSHGRHGVGLLLGSTANGVLHGAKCDVLAVRIKKS